jgi:uncharacterized membrane protein SpoIIM required for sporulation
MKVAELVESRKKTWHELEALCTRLERRRHKDLTPRHVTRFAALYRSACADLALADSYQLPPGTIRYLHHLVGRAHNQLYRSHRFDFAAWRKELLENVPRRLYNDWSLRVAFLLFWGGFLASMFLSSSWSPVPNFAQRVVGEEMIIMLEDMYADPINATGGPTGMETAMAGFYINHNTTIGLRCFAMGLLLGVGGLFATLFNAIALGAMFGHMTTVPNWENFFQFVTAHGPFELTAIVLSAAAGMRLGFSLVDTGGLSRRESLELAARHSMPTMGAAMLLFFLAALIEGFISPSALPYEVKAAVCSLSVLLLLLYFVVLGYEKQVDSG